jgi:hypothetical protein
MKEFNVRYRHFYRLDVILNPENASARGEISFTWRNRSGIYVGKIPILMRNYKRRKDLVQGCQVDGRECKIEYCFQKNGTGFTGFYIKLSKAVKPGKSCSLRISFVSDEVEYLYGFYHFSREVNRVENWCPAAAVMRNGQEYPGEMELADFQVTVKLPPGFKYALSGVVCSEKRIEGEKLLEINANCDCIPDFGILISKDFIVENAASGGVKIHSFFFEKDKKWGTFLLEKAKKIVSFYKKTLGFYPQQTLSILPGGTEPRGGYPVCANCVVIHRGLDKKGRESEVFAEWILAHEIAHQYFGFGHIPEDLTYPRWFGLSMGIYTEQIYCGAADNALKKYKNWRGFYMAGMLAGVDTTIFRKISELEKMPFDWNNVIAHSKSFTVLEMLEQLLGEKTFREIYRTILYRYKGTIITPDMFKEICECASGKELGWFFHQWYRTSSYLDYRVERVITRQEGDFFATEIEVARKGECVMPLPVALETKDGKVTEQKIAGCAERETLVFKTTAKPKRVILDRDGKFPLLSHAESSFEIVRIADISI